MFIFTVLLTGAEDTLSSPIITYPPQLTAVTMPAFGAEAARKTDLSDRDRYALQAGNAPAIPPADLIYYLDMDTGSGKYLRLFQAYYAVQGLSRGDWHIVSALLPRTRAIVLFSPPIDDLDFVLDRLLIHLRQREISPQQIQLTICVPTEQSLLGNQQQMFSILTKRQILKPSFFGIVVEDRTELEEAYRLACPNFWNMAQGEFREVRLVSCALGNAGDAGYSGLAGTFRECAWSNYVDLSPRRAVQMACSRDVAGLLALQEDREQRRLLLSTLINVALHGSDSPQRVGIVNAWNQVDGLVGTDWMLPLLTDDDLGTREAVVDAMSLRRPRSIKQLVNMALDEESDRHGGARTVVVCAANEHIERLLIDALDSPELSRRRIAQDILVELVEQGRPQLAKVLADRMRVEGASYRGQIGAASVLARAGDRRGQQQLQDEFRHTNSMPRRRRIVQEGFEAWDPELFRRLVQEETHRQAQERARRLESLRELFSSQEFGAVLGAGIFMAASMLALSDAMTQVELNQWYGISTNPATLAVVSLICGAITGVILTPSENDVGMEGFYSVSSVLFGLIGGLAIGITLQIEGTLQSDDNPFMVMLLFPLYVINTFGVLAKSVLVGAVAGIVLWLVRRIVTVIVADR